MRVKPEVYISILKDPKWAPFLLFKKDKSVWVDLKKYSANKCYLPINVGFQTYVEGFLFTQQLYADKYRTKDDKVQLEMEADHD